MEICLDIVFYYSAQELLEFRTTNKVSRKVGFVDFHNLMNQHTHTGTKLWPCAIAHAPNARNFILSLSIFFLFYYYPIKNMTELVYRFQLILRNVRRTLCDDWRRNYFFLTQLILNRLVSLILIDAYSRR